MMEREFFIEHIPAVLYGEPAEKAYLFVHGQSGCKEEGAAFAKTACPAGFQVLAVDLPEHGARRGKTGGFDPWTAAPELQTTFAYMQDRWSEIGLRANSIGAHFSMLALGGEALSKALFVSPIVDMERLIADMMGWAGVTESALRTRGEIATDFGQTLSWKYLTWERAHPIRNWSVPTAILYAGRDNLTGRETVNRFVAEHRAALTVLEDGEHWFHTPLQLAALEAWERENI